MQSHTRGLDVLKYEQQVIVSLSIRSQWPNLNPEHTHNLCIVGSVSLFSCLDQKSLSEVWKNMQTRSPPYTKLSKIRLFKKAIFLTVSISTCHQL